MSWQYAIKPDTLGEWVKRVKAGDEVHERAGRPSSLTSDSKNESAAYVAEGVYNVAESILDLHLVDFLDEIMRFHVIDAFGHVGCQFDFAVRCQR